MKKNLFKKTVAGALSVATLCAATPSYSVLPGTAAEEDIIFASGFEDGEGVEYFSRRGETEVLEASTELAHSGDYSLCVSGREKNWNGPQFRLDDGMCKANTEYLVSAWVSGQYYTQVTLSMQYTPEGSTDPVYSNLGTVSGSGWFEFSDVKISFTSDVTDVYVYFEGGNTDNIYVDDFSIEAAPVIPIQEDIASLSDVYSPYFKIGTAITPSNLSSPSFMNLVEKHFGESITAGNELKPDALLDRNASIEAGETNPQVSLAKAKPTLNYCRDNNIPMRGHTLVWHSQTPDWFFKEGYADDGEWVSKEVMLERMENYIKNVFAALEEEYPTVDIYAYDVVNEAWTDQGTPRTAGEQGANGSSNSAWVQVFGDNSFIEPAFEYARKYAPEGCKLYYNDYNEYMTQKTNAIVEMATSLKEKGLIDGIGMQSHLDVRTGSDAFPSISAYEKAMAAFAATGLDIQVTELDATIPGSADSNLEAQAQYYSDILDVCVKYADNISAVVFWGVTDDQSWRASQYPLIFDAGFQAKPAYYSIVDGLDVPVVENNSITVKVIDVDTNELVPGVEMAFYSTDTTAIGTSRLTWNTSDENPKVFKKLSSEPIEYSVGIESLPEGYSLAENKDYSVMFTADMDANAVTFTIPLRNDASIVTTTATTTATGDDDDVFVSMTGVVATIDSNTFTLVGDDRTFTILNGDIDMSSVGAGDTIKFSAYFHVSGDLYGSCGPVEFEIVSKAGDMLYGDANNNGDVEVADAVYVLQGLADPGNADFALSEEGAAAANCKNPLTSGVDAEDALAIQQFKAGLINNLPITEE